VAARTTFIAHVSPVGSSHAATSRTLAYATAIVATSRAQQVGDDTDTRVFSRNHQILRGNRRSQPHD
jgi:hypothetical protein